MIVTAIIMSISLRQKNKMSDEEIKKRAAELGMIENTVLAPTDEEPTPVENPQTDEEPTLEENPQTEEETVTVSPTPVTASAELESAILTPAATQAEEFTVTPTETPAATLTAAAVTPMAKPTETPTPDAKPTLTAAPTPTPTPTSLVLPTETPVADGRDTVTVTINGGEGSGTVSWKVAQAGLVENAADFDSYLCANGFDRYLAAGSHVIPVGASYEEIAQILMRR